MARRTSGWEQVIQNRMIALVLAMLVVVPLVATPADPGVKGIAALAFEGFALLLFGILLWKGSWDLRKESVQSFLRSGVNLPILGFLGIVGISWALSPTRGFGQQEVLRLLAGVLLYFAVATQFKRSEYLSKLVDTLIFLTIGSSLIGFIQFATSSEQYATGMFGDHQLFGSFLMLLLPLVAVTAITEQASNRQLTAQVATVMVTACLLLTHTRSAWMGGAAGLIALGFLAIASAPRRSRLSGKKQDVVLPIMLIAVASGFFLLVSPQGSSIAGRASTLSQVDKEAGWNYRREMWKGGEKMIAAKPLFGFGPGAYPLFQSNYSGMGAPVATTGSRASLGEQAHNFYIQTAAELGIPACLLFISAMVAFLIRGFMRLRSMDAGTRKNLLIGSMAAVVAFAVDAFGSPSWQFGQIMMFFWLVMGLGVSCMRITSRSKDEAHKTASVPLRVSRPAAVLGALALAAMLPSVVNAAGGGGYLTVKKVVITPVNATITSGQSLNYTLTVTWSDNTVQDVSNDSRTTFASVNGAGSMIVVSPNTRNRTYKSTATEVDKPTISGTFVFNNAPNTDKTNLIVKKP